MQREKGKRERNDRFLLRPAAEKAMKEQQTLTAQLKKELDQFFRGAVFGTGKDLTVEGWGGADVAIAAIRKGSHLANST